MKPAEIRTADVNGITIAYQVMGSGFPLILINGFASTMDMWNPPFLAALAKHFRIIMFDNRGSGYSSSSDERFTIPLFADDTLALMDALGISRAHILGLSMGASIAQELVLSRPQRVDHLILVAGTCGGGQGIPPEPEVWQTLSDKSGTGAELADRMFSVLFPKEWLTAHDPWKYCPEVREITSEENAARQAEAFYTWPGSYDRLPQIQAPALVMTGTDDVVIPPANASLLAQRIPGARLVKVPKAGHGLLYQDPGRCAGAVLEFLPAGMA